MLWLYACKGRPTHIEKSFAFEEGAQLFCSEVGVSDPRFKLTIETKNTQMPGLSISKVLELPFIRSDKPFSPTSISRGLILWRDDIVILAEIIPSETLDIYFVYVTSFARVKDMNTYISNAFLVLRLCQEGELSLGSSHGLISLKARLELIGSSTTN